MGNPRTSRTVNAGAVGSAPFMPSLGLHPSNVESLEGYEEHKGYVASALSAFSTATVGLEEIAKARTAVLKNQAWHPWQQLLNVASFAEKKMLAMTRAFDSARENLTKAADHLDKSLSQPLESQALGALNAEIRAHVKNLPNKERADFMYQAVQREDMKILGSVLGAPSFLSGLAEIEHQRYTRLYHENKSPELVARLKIIREAIDLVEKRGPLVFKQVEEAMGGTFELVGKLRQADAEARKALMMDQNAPPAE